MSGGETSPKGKKYRKKKRKYHSRTGGTVSPELAFLPSLENFPRLGQMLSAH
jgi:hypothetical protein